MSRQLVLILKSQDISGIFLCNSVSNMKLQYLSPHTIWQKSKKYVTELSLLTKEKLSLMIHLKNLHGQFNNRKSISSFRKICKRLLSIVEKTNWNITKTANCCLLK